MVTKTIYFFRVNVLFIILPLLYLSILFASSSLIYNDSFYYSLYGKILDFDRVEQMILMNKKYNWVNLITIPFFLYLKWFIIAGIIYIGTNLSDLKLAYINSLKIILIAEFIWIISGIIKMVYFVIYPPTSIEDWQNLSLLSLANFFSLSKLPTYYVFLIQQINLFELFYCILIAFGVMKFCSISFRHSLKIVLFSYGLMLILWVLIIVFLLLQFN